jgi:hypothetical protein
MKEQDLRKYQIEVLVNALNPSNIKETCPVLLVGKAVSLFKIMYKDPIRELKNNDDVKEFISEYTGIKTPKPVVISDLGNLQRQSAFLLLKLVEEAEFPIILLSTEDKVDSILLSRIKRIIKFPLDNKTNNSLIPISDAYDKVYGNDTDKTMNKVAFYAENCPMMFKLEQDIPYNKYRNAMIKILGDTYDY